MRDLADRSRVAVKRPWLIAVPLGLTLMGAWAVCLRTRPATVTDVVRFAPAPEVPATRLVAATRPPSSTQVQRNVDSKPLQADSTTPLAVIVRDSTGASLSGVAVRFEERPNLRVGSMVVSTQAGKSYTGLTDGAGTAVGNVLRTSVIEVCASQPGYATATATAQPGRTTMDLVLRRPSSVKLQVLDDASGLPIRLGAFDVEINGASLTTVSNDEGIVHLRDLTPGKIVGELRSHTTIPAPISLKSVDEGAEATCEIRVRRGRNLRSFVHLNGLPADRATVTIFDRWTSRSVARVITGADGIMSLPVGIDGHDYVAIAELGEYAGQVLLAANGKTSELALRSTWSFSVAATADGRELPSARAILVRTDGLPSGPTGRGVEFTFNQHGYAHVEGLTDGVGYRMVVVAEGRAIGEWRNLDQSNASSSQVVCNLPPASSIGGRVLAHDGTPVVGAVVRATRADSANGPSMFTVTDADGRYSFNGLAPGHVNILPFFPGFDGRRRASTTGNFDVDVLLDPL